MTKPPPSQPRTRNVRGKTDPNTHNALRARQLQIEQASGIRPGLTDVVTTALKEWAEQQPS